MLKTKIKSVLFEKSICKYVIFMLFLLGVMLTSCSQSVRIDDVYKKYSSGAFTKEWDDGCIHISALMVTPEFFALLSCSESKEEKISKRKLDSIIAIKKQDTTISFRIRIEPVGKCIDTTYAHNSDIVYGFGRSDDDRSKEIEKYNFGLDKRIWLKCGDTRVDPLFCHTENNFGLDNGRDIWVGFAIDKNKMLLSKDNVLFFQGPTPVSEIIAMEWSSELMRKMVSGGRL